MKALFCIFLLTAQVFADNSSSLDTHMDTQTKMRSGMNKLTPTEKKALQDWINTHHTLTPSDQDTKPYTGTGAVLSQNIAGGRYIELADDSLWQVNPVDVATTSGWISPILINVTTNPDSNWPYLLTNSASGSKASAKPITALPQNSNKTSFIDTLNKKNPLKN